MTVPPLILDQPLAVVVEVARSLSEADVDSCLGLMRGYIATHKVVVDAARDNLQVVRYRHTPSVSPLLNEIRRNT